MRNKNQDAQPQWERSPSREPGDKRKTDRGRDVIYSEQGLEALQDRLERLRLDLGARGAMLLDPSGQLLTESGRRGHFDTATFLALLGNAMAAATQVAQMLRDENAFDLHCHQGEKNEIFTARVTDQVFLCLLLERTETSSRVGMVWLSLRRAAADLRELLAQDMMVAENGLGKDLRVALGSSADNTNGSGGNQEFESALDDELDRLLGPSEPSPSPEPPAALEPPRKQNVKRQFDDQLDQMLRTWNTPSTTPTPPSESAPERPVPQEDPDSGDLDGDTILTYEQAVKLGLIKDQSKE